VTQLKTEEIQRLETRCRVEREGWRER
jgi:hypothetical protein